MARSRSLFDDLEFAIATATSLTAGDDPKSSSQFIPTQPLVSFDHPVPSMDPARRAKEAVELPAPKIEIKPPEPPFVQPEEPEPKGSAPAATPAPTPASAPKPASTTKPASATERPTQGRVARAPQTLVARVSDPPAEKPTEKPAEKPAEKSTKGEPPPQIAKVEPSLSHANDEPLNKKDVPPKLPDLSGIASPLARCEKIVSWIAEATGATDVFLADSAGYPLAGAIKDADAKLASIGVVASSVTALAASIAPNVSPLFELHLGEGPFFQVVGFKAGASMYIVGFLRGTPLTPRQAHAIRLACRHALGDTLRGGLWETE